MPKAPGGRQVLRVLSVLQNWAVVRREQALVRLHLEPEVADGDLLVPASRQQELPAAPREPESSGCPSHPMLPKSLRLDEEPQSEDSREQPPPHLEQWR